MHINIKLSWKTLIGLAVIIVLTVILILCANPLYDSLSKSGSSQATENTGAPPAVVTEGSYAPGTYEADEEGMYPMTVRVTFDSGSIVDIEIENTETEGIGSVAVEKLPAEIIEKQSLAIDGISGATLSSNAIIAGVADCVAQAGGDVDALK